MTTRGTSIDAITLLKEDHQKVRGLLEKLDKTTERAGETREKLLAKIEQELKIHTTIEEEIFYPAYKAAVSKREDTRLYQEALEEHHVVDVVVSEIKASDTESEVFSAKAKVLKELVQHHAEEEEKQMFPRARRAMEASELKELGARMDARKKEMQASAEGWLPAAGKLIAAVAQRVAPEASRPRSVAARGAAAKARTKPAKSATRARSAKSGKSAKPARSRSAKGRKK